MALTKKGAEALKRTFNEINQNQMNSIPLYKGDIESERDAERLPDLPLFYIWNEKIAGNGDLSYTLSVNGTVIGRVLEKHLPRAHKDFVAVRSFIMGKMRDAQAETVRHAIAKLKLPPSRIWTEETTGHRVRAPTNEERLGRIARATIDEIWDGPGEKFLPVYRGDLKSKEHAETLSDDLPLIFIFDERQVGKSFTFTLGVNGSIIDRIFGKAVAPIGP